jgi:hypothetical protein
MNFVQSGPPTWPHAGPQSAAKADTAITNTIATTTKATLSNSMMRFKMRYLPHP